MALYVKTNMTSQTVQHNLYKTINQLNHTLEKLSAGRRINRAGDDPSGLAISDTMQAHIRSINQAVRNSNDAISFVQVAESGLNEMGNVVSRMRELAMQAANEGLSAQERSDLNDEYLVLKDELNRISDTTEFMNSNPLNGSLEEGVAFQVGYQNTPDDRIEVSIQNTDAAALGLDTEGAADLESAESAQSALDVIDTSAMAVLSERRSDLGVVTNRLEYAISNLQAASSNFTAANAGIRDADFALETALNTKSQIMNKVNISIMAQANILPQRALRLLG